MLCWRCNKNFNIPDNLVDTFICKKCSKELIEQLEMTFSKDNSVSGYSISSIMDEIKELVTLNIALEQKGNKLPKKTGVLNTGVYFNSIDELFDDDKYEEISEALFAVTIEVMQCQNMLLAEGETEIYLQDMEDKFCLCLISPISKKRAPRKKTSQSSK